MEAPTFRATLQQAGLTDWPSFADSWNDLGLDTYMADGGHYRRRRHAAFSVDAHAIRRKPHQPHYQSRDCNALNGGLARWFEAVKPAVASTVPEINTQGFSRVMVAIPIYADRSRAMLQGVTFDHGSVILR